MKIYSIIFIISAFILTACSSSQSNNTAANTANAINTANSAVNAANVTVQNLPPEQKPSTVSPTETMKAMNEAAKAKNPAALKLVISKGTLALIEKNAQEQGTTVEELLSRDEDAPFQETPEMRNEKITGNRATVELKNTRSGEWSTLPFVKEDGVWKVAMDEYLENVRKQMTEQMNDPATNKASKK